MKVNEFYSVVVLNVDGRRATGLVVVNLDQVSYQMGGQTMKNKVFCELEDETWARYARHIEKCGLNRGIHHDEIRDQVDWMHETFLDEFQIKIVDDNLVKIKWEITCPWLDCYHPLYESYLCDPNSGRGWEEPYAMYQRDLCEIADFIDSEME